jgi:predicted P-loop ATPase
MSTINEIQARAEAELEHRLGCRPGKEVTANQCRIRAQWEREQADEIRKLDPKNSKSFEHLAQAHEDAALAYAQLAYDLETRGLPRGFVRKESETE